jgi:hypothetical protein
MPFQMALFPWVPYMSFYLEDLKRLPLRVVLLQVYWHRLWELMVHHCGSVLREPFFHQH